ncbi:MAG TPA: hypothetical protein PKA12_08835 [Saprospiraceae bacterium]|nr:hypothetical protein [Saprospiraceae bacterium]
MWFNKKSGRMPEDRGWEAMRQMLDKELPEKKRKNRLMLWFWPLLLGLGLGYYYTFTNSSNDHSPTQSKRAGDIVNLQTREEVNPPIVVETPNHEPITTNLSLHKEESIKTAPVERELKKNKKITIQENNQTKNSSTPPYLTQLSIHETALPASNQIPADHLDEQAVEVEQAIERNVEENRNTWITTFLAEKPLQPIADNSDDQMPAVALISNKAGWTSAFKPYVAVAGLMSHDTKDKGYSLGAGLLWKPFTRLFLSAGIHYENYRGTYAYPAKSIALDLKSQDFNALTNVRQWSVPVLLHLNVIGDRLRIQGGVVSNYIRKTNEYYALPALANVELAPGAVENSLSYASAAANTIPRHYFEWQTGLSYRFWKSFSGTAYYRRQFEKENPGIVPSTGLYGLQLTYQFK